LNSISTISSGAFAFVVGVSLLTEVLSIMLLTAGIGTLSLKQALDGRIGIGVEARDDALEVGEDPTQARHRALHRPGDVGERRLGRAVEDHPVGERPAVPLEDVHDGHPGEGLLDVRPGAIAQVLAHVGGHLEREEYGDLRAPGRSRVHRLRVRDAGVRRGRRRFEGQVEHPTARHTVEVHRVVLHQPLGGGEADLHGRAALDERQRSVEREHQHEEERAEDRQHEADAEARIGASHVPSSFPRRDTA